jgi:hypothetical protein
MSNITNYWNSPTDEQHTITKEVKQQAKTQQPGQMPTRVTLENALNTGEDGMEFAICACMLFIIVVQDRGDLGGGYGVQLTAIGHIRNEYFDTLDVVESWLDANAPYTKHSPVWVPVPVYNPHKDEMEALKKLW